MGLVACGLALLAVAPATAAPPSGRAVQRSTGELDELVQALHATGDEEAFRRGARELARDAIAPLVEVFLAGDPDVPGRPTGHDELFLETLHRLGDRSVLAAVEARAGDAEPARVIRLRGEFGGPELLGELYRDAAADATRSGDPRGLQRALRVATRRLLERHPGAYGQARRLLSDLGPRDAELLLGGLADTGSPQAVELLASLALQEDEPAARALAHLADAARAGRAPFPESIAAGLRPLLYSDRPARLAGALRALGELEDPETMPHAIELLDHAAREVHDAAAAALPLIAGITLPPDSERWRGWYERELDWWEGEAPDLRAALWDGTPEEVLGAIAKVVLHPAFRHELSLDLTPLLRHEDARIRRLAAGALAQLGSAAAVEDLLDAAGEAEGDEAEAYRTALRRLLRAPKPTDPPHWSVVWGAPAPDEDVR